MRLEGIVVAFIPQRPFRGSGTSRYDSDVHVSTGHTLFTNWTIDGLRKTTGGGGTFLRADQC